MECLVDDGEKMCSNFCSALGMLSTSPGKFFNDIYQINKASRGVAIYLDRSKLTLEHAVQATVLIQLYVASCTSI